jgi:hypothetical protein
LPLSRSQCFGKIGIAKGNLANHAIGLPHDDDRSAYIGTGVLDAIEALVRNIDTYVTMLANADAKQENPPTDIRT